MPDAHAAIYATGALANLLTATHIRARCPLACHEERTRLEGSSAQHLVVSAIAAGRIPFRWLFLLAMISVFTSIVVRQGRAHWALVHIAALLLAARGSQVVNSLQTAALSVYNLACRDDEGLPAGRETSLRWKLRWTCCGHAPTAFNSSRA